MSIRALIRPDILVPLALLALGCGCGTENVLAPESDLHSELDLQLSGVHHNVTVDGVLRLVITADSANLSMSRATTELRSVRVVILDRETGENVGALEADRGMLDPLAGLLSVESGVVLTPHSGGWSLEAGVLHLDLRRDRIWSEHPVVLRQDGDTEPLHRLEMDTRLQKTGNRADNPPFE